MSGRWLWIAVGVFLAGMVAFGVWYLFLGGKTSLLLFSSTSSQTPSSYEQINPALGGGTKTPYPIKK